LWYGKVKEKKEGFPPQQDKLLTEFSTRVNYLSIGSFFDTIKIYLETLFADFLKRNLLRLNELDYTIFSTIDIISISLKNKRKTSLFPLKSKKT